MGGDFEDETADGLCEWANGLGLCEFTIVEKWGDRYVCAGDDRANIEMSFSRFDDSVPEVGGFRMVSYGCNDHRDCTVGYGCGIAFRDKLAAALERDVERLSLYSGQMHLF